MIKLKRERERRGERAKGRKGEGESGRQGDWATVRAGDRATGCEAEIRYAHAEAYFCYTQFREWR